MRLIAFDKLMRTNNTVRRLTLRQELWLKLSNHPSSIYLLDYLKGREGVNHPTHFESAWQLKRNGRKNWLAFKRGLRG